MRDEIIESAVVALLNLLDSRAGDLQAQREPATAYRTLIGTGLEFNNDTLNVVIELTADNDCKPGIVQKIFSNKIPG